MNGLSSRKRISGIKIGNAPTAFGENRKRLYNERVVIIFLPFVSFLCPSCPRCAACQLFFAHGRQKEIRDTNSHGGITTKAARGKVKTVFAFKIKIRGENYNGKMDTNDCPSFV